MKAINYKTIAILSLLVFVFLLGFSLSVQAYRISQQELNSPVSQYLRENYGVNSIEEYRAKLEQEVWLNFSRQMEALASKYPEINFSEWRSPDVYRQYGTSSYQPPKITPQQPFYIAIFSEPVTALQIFSLSGLGLIGLAAVSPIRKNERLKQVLIFGIIILIVFSIGYFVGLTAAQTGTITIEPGSFTETASYVIWTDGTTVYAKNGKTGAIEFSGSDASAVIQSAINALTNGGKILLKNGVYNVYASSPIPPIEPKDNVSIEGESRTKTIIKVVGGSGYVVRTTAKRTNIGIRNLMIDGNGMDVSLIDISQDDEWVWIEDCNLINARRFNIIMAGNQKNVFIRRNYFTKCPDHLGYDFCSVHFENILFEDNLLVLNTTTLCQGITSGFSHKIRIINNVIIMPAPANAISLENGIPPSGYTYPQDTIVIKGNICVNGRISVGSGDLGNIYGARNAIISDNVAIKIELDHAIQNIIISNNMTNDRIYIDTGTDVDSGYVLVEGNTSAGIGYILRYSASAKSVKNVLIQNNFFNAETLPSYEYLFYIDILPPHTTYDFQIKNNFIYNPNGAKYHFVWNSVRPVIKGNCGFNSYVTENSGTAILPSGQTSVTVAHGLATTPSKVLVTPRANIGSVWVSAINSTHITISCSTAPTADTIVDWYAEV